MNATLNHHLAKYHLSFSSSWTVTANEIRFYPAFVCLWLWETARKNYGTNQMLMNSKILPQMYLWTRKNCSNSGNHPHLDPDPGFFFKDYSTLQDTAFFAMWLISLKNSSDIHEYFITDISLDRKSPIVLKVIQIPESGSGLQIQTRDLDQIRWDHLHLLAQKYYSQNTSHSK